MNPTHQNPWMGLHGAALEAPLRCGNTGWPHTWAGRSAPPNHPATRLPCPHPLQDVSWEGSADGRSPSEHLLWGQKE